jgi:SAM-dependent methyltransferase
MGDVDPRRFRDVFDSVAAEYDRRRPAYPDELIDHACRLGDLIAGTRVLEIGCGTGQLTRALIARGLHVTAVEPGENLISLAGGEPNAPGRVQFVNERFEDAAITGRFAAIFSASAFHWLDPDVSWRKVARLLAPGGLLALIQYCAAREERTAPDADALMDALRYAAPDIAEGWPPLREVAAIVSGIEDRRGNVSDVWAWLGSYAVARSYAADLFRDLEVAVQPALVEQTADELNALFRTTSVYHRLSPSQRDALERANRAIGERLGRPIRSSMVAVLVAARRA